MMQSKLGCHANRNVAGVAPNVGGRLVGRAAAASHTAENNMLHNNSRAAAAADHAGVSSSRALVGFLMVL
jgi:hypothetical protein